nr:MULTISPECIES: MBL fold metallo-hydrolase [unclassified Paenibacillus]
MLAEYVTHDVFWKRLIMVNVVFVGRPGADDGEWVLVDAGLKFSANAIERAARERLAYHGRPACIVMTHGHFDHVGALQELAERWDVPVYAHEKELPYLTGSAAYLPPDPSVGGGMMSAVSPLYPNGAIDLGERAQPLPEDGTVPGLAGWRWVATPGHTPGHISLFREEDRTLIAGDAFTTVKQESALHVITQHKSIHGPPMYFTPDWKSAKASVQALRELRPAAAVTGHGLPIFGGELEHHLEVLSDRFEQVALPEHGKYADAYRERQLK